ncbi:hypothetical protein KPL70_004670 [Citrus sinensis]|nr:hypothetical protein KPL70_004670 [Citrus sinensis]
MEMWTGKLADYSYLHAFGCPMYVVYNAQERTKLDPKSRRCIFLGYADGVKGRFRFFGSSTKARRPRTSRVRGSRFRRSTRKRRPPTWHSEYVTDINVACCLLTKDEEPSTFHETLNSSDVALWMTTMQEEIEAIHKNKTWKLVSLPHGRKAIGNKWAYKIKRDSNDQVERYRARLVVKGYAQKEGIDFNEIFSPVVRLTTVRVVLMMCAIFNLHLEQLDVKTAFLHGELEEEIYMLQPEGFAETGKENFVCRLNKSLYGLKQAPRCWYKRFDSFIMSLGYNRLSSDYCTYYKREFEMKDLGPVNKILGMQIHRDRNNMKIWLSQKNYLKKILRRFNMQDCKSISTPLSVNFKLSSSMCPSNKAERKEMSRVSYASAVGSLMFAMICTRPYIAQAVGAVSRYMANLGGEHWIAVKRILRYIRGTSDVALCYGGSEFTVRGYVDSDFAGELDKRSLNFNNNELEGAIPQSFINCTKLEVLYIGNNKINDVFPYWLGNLPELRVLVLRSNKLRGSVKGFESKESFHKLRILDLSINNFSGYLPARFFEKLNAMRNVGADEGKLRYLGEEYYQDSVLVTLKGTEIELQKILTVFTTIDFSSNGFDGEISQVIGKLHSLRLLNLTHNHFTGKIPSSLGNLAKLESLDLSSNNLTGKIPKQLASLTSLPVLNLSHNRLDGPIPQGPQFNTIQEDSYIGNLGLCGFPLTKKCGNDGVPTTFHEEEEEAESSSSWFDWKFAKIGYGSGLVIGLSIGYMVFASREPLWFMKMVVTWQSKKNIVPGGIGRI